MSEINSDLRIKNELLCELFKRTRAASIGQMVTSLIVIFILGSHLSQIPYTIPILTFGILLPAFVRYVISHAVFSNFRWRMPILFISTMILGLSWGVLGPLSEFREGLLSIPTLALIIIGSGIAAGGSYSMAPNFRLGQLFCFLVLFPISVTASLSPVADAYVISVLSAVFLIFLLSQAKNNHALLLHNFTLVEEQIRHSKNALESEREVMLQKEKNQQMVKLAALGTMAGGIAHEINNPLAIVMARVAIMRRLIFQQDLDLPTRLSAELDHVEKTFLRVSKIIKGLQAYARNHSQEKMEIVSLHSIFDDTLEWCRPRMQKNEVVLQEPKIDRELFIECRPVQISEVIVNLCNNAVEAISDMNEKWIQIEVLGDTEFVYIRVIDSGHGIPKEIAEQIMNPFFTTKGASRGTGLGLSIAQRIVDDHKGELKLDQQNKNTCFVLKFPRVKSRTTFDRESKLPAA